MPESFRLGQPTVTRRELLNFIHYLTMTVALPSYVCMTAGSQSDVRHAKYMVLPVHSVVVMDRGYQSSRMYWQWTQRDIYFVTRLKDSIKYDSLKEKELPDDSAENILLDEIIELSENDSKKDYPGRLRRVVVYDKEQDRTIILLTNNFTWTAKTIAELYKQRWSVEIFFKELKQHLKIKSFIGTNENAMWIQIWTAMITILLLRYMREIAKYSWNLSNLIGFIRINLFVKMDLIAWLNNPFWPQNQQLSGQEQLEFL